MCTDSTETGMALKPKHTLGHPIPDTEIGVKSGKTAVVVNINIRLKRTR